MGWATVYVEKLFSGECVDFRLLGNSTQPIIKSGEHVFVEPITENTELSIKDVVLCKVSDKQYLHLVTII